MSKAAVKKITSTLGSSAIAERLGVSHHSIRHARYTGSFPAGWYDELDKLCGENGIECPRSAFNWKSSSPEASEAKGVA